MFCCWYGSHNMRDTSQVSNDKFLSLCLWPSRCVSNIKLEGKIENMIYISTKFHIITSTSFLKSNFYFIYELQKFCIVNKMCTLYWKNNICNLTSFQASRHHFLTGSDVKYQSPAYWISLGCIVVFRFKILLLYFIFILGLSSGWRW